MTKGFGHNFQKLLEHSVEYIRYSSVWDIEVQRFNQNVIHDNPVQRIKALHRLRELVSHRSDHVFHVMDFVSVSFADPDPIVQLEALRIMREVSYIAMLDADSGGAVYSNYAFERIREAFNLFEDSDVKVQAIDYTAQIALVGSPLSRENLFHILECGANDKDKSVRAAAVRQLAKLGASFDKFALPVIEIMVRKETDNCDVVQRIASRVIQTVSAVPAARLALQTGLIDTYVA